MLMTFLCWNTNELTIISFRLASVCMEWRGEGTSVHSHMQSKSYQLQGRANKSHPASPGTFYQALVPSIWSQTKSRANLSSFLKYLLKIRNF